MTDHERPGPWNSMDDHELALALAHAAGRRLLEVREPTSGEGAARGSRPPATARRRRCWRSCCRGRVPTTPCSARRRPTTRRGSSAERVWIIDPLDGTREFSEAGRSDWAVHVALWERGDARRRRGGAAGGRPVLRHRGPPVAVPAPRSGPLRLAVSRTRPPAFVQRLAEQLGAELVPMGSAGVKATSVLRGEADAYVHAGGQYEWDSAAPVAVAAAAGLHTSRVDGSPLRVQPRGPAACPDLVVCRPEHADRDPRRHRRQLGDGDAGGSSDDRRAPRTS